MNSNTSSVAARANLKGDVVLGVCAYCKKENWRCTELCSCQHCLVVPGLFTGNFPSKMMVN